MIIMITVVVYCDLFSQTYTPLFVHNTCSTMYRLWTLEREGIVLNMLPNVTTDSLILLFVSQ